MSEICIYVHMCVRIYRLAPPIWGEVAEYAHARKGLVSRLALQRNTERAAMTQVV